MPVCYAPPVETGPYQKGGEFLEPPVPTTPQRSNVWPPFGYNEGVELEGARKSTIIILTVCNLSLKNAYLLASTFYGNETRVRRANNESSEVFEIIKPGRRVKMKGSRQ